MSVYVVCNLHNNLWKVESILFLCYNIQLHYTECENISISHQCFHLSRQPYHYEVTVLPTKLPPLKQPVPVTSLPMLGYLEQTAATAIINALSAVGSLKPKYPFLNSTKSALIYVAYHLKGMLVIMVHDEWWSVMLIHFCTPCNSSQVLDTVCGCIRASI